MKKKFVKVLSVMMAMLTLLTASVLPITATETDSRFIEDTEDSYGNYMQFILGIKKEDNTLKSLNGGGQLATSNVLPADDSTNVALEFYAEVYYRDNPTYAYTTRAINYIDDLDTNSYYNVGTTNADYTTGVYYFDQSKMVHRVVSCMRLRYDTATNTSEVPEFTIRLTKSRGQLLDQ